MLSYADSTSPIHRGVFLSRSILGNVLKPPVNAIAPLSAHIHPDLTTRERVALQTKASACQTCHAMINPLGFALEEYDALGRLRTTEDGNGQNMPINAEGTYQPHREGGQFWRTLGQFLAKIEMLLRPCPKSFPCTRQTASRGLGQQRTLTITDRFVSEKYSIRKLIVEIALVMTKPSKSTSNN